MAAWTVGLLVEMMDDSRVGHWAGQMDLWKESKTAAELVANWVGNLVEKLAAD